MLGGKEYKVCSDAAFAIITEREDPCSYQRIDGKLHYVLATGTRVPCDDAVSDEAEEVLKKSGTTLRNFTTKEMSEPLINRSTGGTK